MRKTLRTASLPEDIVFQRARAFRSSQSQAADYSSFGSAGEYRWTDEFSGLKIRFEEELSILHGIVSVEVATLSHDSLNMAVSTYELTEVLKPFIK